MTRCLGIERKSIKMNKKTISLISVLLALGAVSYFAYRSLETLKDFDLDFNEGIDDEE